MDILALSVILRALESAGQTNPFPAGGYKGAYIRDIAAGIDRSWLTGVTATKLYAGLPEDGPTGDQEAVISALGDRRERHAHRAFGR